MTYKDKLKVAQAIGSVAWKIVVFVVTIVIWVHIADGIIHKDYMQVVAWVSIYMMIQLNEIEEKL